MNAIPKFAPLTPAEIAAQQVLVPETSHGDLVVPVPDNAPKLPNSHPTLGQPSSTWTYLDASGAVMHYVFRLESQDGKQILPLTLWRGQNGLRWRWKAIPDCRPLYGLDKLAARAGAYVVVCEGEKCADAASEIFPKSVCVTSSGGSQAFAKTDWSPLAGRTVLIWPDNDAPGAKYAENVAEILQTLGCTAQIIDAFKLASIAPGGGAREPTARWDCADALAAWPDKAALRRAALDCASVVEGELISHEIAGKAAGQSQPSRWPLPQPIAKSLLPVASFDAEFLPKSIAPWCLDIADRMQCPLDFVAIPAIIALGSVLGRKVAIRPQRLTDWVEVPNLWGCIVGRPGTLKSPAMNEALKPLQRLEALARQDNEAAAGDYARAVEMHKLAREEAGKKARAILKNNGDASHLLDLDEPEKPQARRYIAGDCTYEKLGEILADNPNGILTFRDELISLLKTLDREEYAAARGFFLSAWNGTSGYSFDRIIRGSTHIEAACLSLLGSTQPGRLAEYVKRATSGGGDDGFIQRFSLLVWPDQVGNWKEVDRYPDSPAREAAWGVFDRLNALQPDGIGAQADNFDALPFLRFDGDAQGVFTEWRVSLEAKLRSGELSPALESHFAKFRKLVPSLALINHLADGCSGPVAETALLRAISLADYLESHARRAYGAGLTGDADAGLAILAHIRKGDLTCGFTAREVHQHGWANLATKEAVQAGLDLLCDHDWLVATTLPTAGRPRIIFTVNPRGMQ